MAELAGRGEREVRVSGLEGASSAADATTGVADQAEVQARRGAGIARENPLGLAIASVCAGLILGMLLPSTRAEDERLGPVADSVKQQGREVAGEAADHAKQVAQEVAETATQTAKDQGRSTPTNCAIRWRTAADVQGSGAAVSEGRLP